MKRLANLLGILALFAMGCDGGGSGYGLGEIDLSPKPYDLTGLWSGSIGDGVRGKVQIIQDKTTLTILDEDGYFSKGTNLGGEVELTDSLGRRMRAIVFSRDELSLFEAKEEGFGERIGRLVRLP